MIPISGEQFRRYPNIRCIVTTITSAIGTDHTKKNVIFDIKGILTLYLACVRARGDKWDIQFK